MTDKVEKKVQATYLEQQGRRHVSGEKPSKRAT